MVNFQLVNWFFFNIGFIKKKVIKQIDIIVINELKYLRKKNLNLIIMRVLLGGCYLFFVDDQVFYVCWICCYDIGCFNIFFKNRRVFVI